MGDSSLLNLRASRDVTPERAAVDRKADFMLIGAAKAGTTTLYHYLTRHPGVFMPADKEPGFFSDDCVWSCGWEWYRSLYAGAAAHQVCGEASTTYTRWPHTADVPTRIFQLCPQTKFIYVMRHPVDRAYSHYGHHMRTEVTRTFEEALEHNDIYVDCSLYMQQIDRYLRLFPREQFLFLLLDDLKADAAGLLLEVQRFIGVEPYDLTSDGCIMANRGGARPWINRKLTRQLQSLRSVPGVAMAARLVPVSWRRRAFHMLERSSLGAWMGRSYRLPPMLPETRRRLLERFESETLRLEGFLGREIPNWHR